MCFSVQNDSKHIIFKKKSGRKSIIYLEIAIQYGNTYVWSDTLPLSFETPIRDSKKKSIVWGQGKEAGKLSKPIYSKIAKQEQIMVFSNLYNFKTSRLMLENSLTIQDFKKLPDIFQFVNCLVPIQENVFSRTFVMYLQCLAMTSSLPAQSIAT